MDYLPIFAAVHSRPCLVIGGGIVALRKVRQLLRAGARVTVNAPHLHPDLTILVEEGRIEHAASEFDAALIERHLLIIAATDDAGVNREAARISAERLRLCNVVDDGANSGYIMPSIIDRSPLVVAVSTGGQAPMLARMIRQRIESWLPGRIDHLARWIDRWRSRVQARFSSHEQRVDFWQRTLDGPAAERVLAGQSARADQLIERALGTDHEPGPGEAWIVGAGPGDPDLLTQRGLALLQRADAVLHDALVPQAIVDLARRDAELVCVGKRSGRRSTSQAEINAELVRRVRAGQRVCRLKGGDPFVYGRGGEELQALAAAGLPYQVVPGITAATGCAAYAGIPLTHRDLADGVIFVTGHHAEGHQDTDWAALARSRYTIVVYMAGRRLGAVCAALREAGRAPGTPAALLSQGTTQQQQIYGGTLADLPARAAAAPTPALLIVGDVAALAQELHWFGDTAPDKQAAAG